MLAVIAVVTLQALDLQQLMVAWADFHQHAWVAGGAVATGLLVALIKQGWLSTWLQAKIPAKARPWFAMAVSVIGMVSLQVQAGTPLATAILNGLTAAATAVMGHQVIVEGMRGGHEIVPSAPWCRDDPKV